MQTELHIDAWVGRLNWHQVQTIYSPNVRMETIMCLLGKTESSVVVSRVVSNWYHHVTCLLKTHTKQPTRHTTCRTLLLAVFIFLSNQLTKSFLLNLRAFNRINPRRLITDSLVCMHVCLVLESFKALKVSVLSWSWELNVSIPSWSSDLNISVSWLT